jgi:hypothetical protein
MRGNRIGSMLVGLLAAAAALGACTGGVATPSAAPRTPVSTPAVPTATPPLRLSADPIPSEASTSPPVATPAATPDPGADPFVGTVVATLADRGLRVRSAPRVSDDSYKFEPLLPLGTTLFVVGGPVDASGYTWYEVAPMASGGLPTGWVASADRGGMPWIGATSADCPPVPADFASLAALPQGVGPACFPQLPITVRARLLSCNCDMDGAWHEPFWFVAGSGRPDVLVEPGSTDVPEDFGDWFILNMDPNGEHPANLPYGEVVEATGMFDHPAAEGCTLTEPDGEPVASGGCRLAFAVTRLAVVGQ